MRRASRRPNRCSGRGADSTAAADQDRSDRTVPAEQFMRLTTTHEQTATTLLEGPVLDGERHCHPRRRRRTLE